MKEKKEHLTSSQRGELLSRIATSDYDAIIIPQTAFKMLQLNPETVRNYIQHELDTLTGYLEDFEPASGKNRRSIKEVQRAIKKLKALPDQNPSPDGAFTIKLKRSVRNDEWLSFDHRAQAGEHLDKLRRQVGMRLDSEYCFIGSYRGFQILVQRLRDRNEAFFFFRKIYCTVEPVVRSI